MLQETYIFFVLVDEAIKIAVRVFAKWACHVVQEADGKYVKHKKKGVRQITANKENCLSWIA